MIQNPAENVDSVQDTPTGHFRRQVKAPAILMMPFSMLTSISVSIFSLGTENLQFSSWSFENICHLPEMSVCMQTRPWKEL